MDTLSALASGFGVALAPGNLLVSALGVALGAAAGRLAGAGPALAVALLLPFTFGLDSTGAALLLGGAYLGALGGRATAATGFAVGGLLGALALAVAAPLMANLSLLFDAPERFALLALAMFTVAARSGAPLSRALLSLLLGLAFSLVGIDLQTGEMRFTLGRPELLGGLAPVIAALGLLAVGETLWSAARARVEGEGIAVAPQMGREGWARAWKPWLRGAVVGFPTGVLPAGGPEAASALSLGAEARLARRRADVGSRAVEAGPEAARGAAGVGVLASLLALGLPTSVAAAVLLVALRQHGVEPGPALLDTEPRLAWGLIASLFVGHLLLLGLLAGLGTRVLAVPPPWIGAGVLTFATLGAYALNSQVGDVWVLWGVGVAGFGLRAAGVPLAPALMGLVLGPIAEQQLRGALAELGGGPMAILAHPLAVVLLLLVVAVLLAPALRRRRRSAP